MKIPPQLLRTSLCWLLLAAFILLSSPAKLPVVVLIVPFVLLYAALYSTWNLIEAARSRISPKTAGKRHKPLGAAISFGLVLILILQSLGQLTIRDVVTIAAITVLGYLYFGRSRFVFSQR